MGFGGGKSVRPPPLPPPLPTPVEIAPEAMKAGGAERRRIRGRKGRRTTILTDLGVLKAPSTQQAALKETLG